MTEFNRPARERASRLYRDTDKGRLLGVCAGIADYFGFDVTGTRIVALISLVFFMPATLLIYFGLAILLPKRSDVMPSPEMDSDFRKEVRASPQSTLSGTRHRFRELDLRLQRMERYVTSPRFQLDREFRDLHGRDARRDPNPDAR
jgi:phage shock protein C